MRIRAGLLLGIIVWLPQPAHATPGYSDRLTYSVYAAGLHVADVETRLASGPWTYQLDLAYHTTGLVGFFDRGRQLNSVNGTWQADQADPESFNGVGVWRGHDRVARIDYENGMPIIRQLVPANEAERQPVPPAMQAHSIDTLSALLELLRTVAQTGRCELTVRTYDGRRATEVEAHTAGEDVLAQTDRSSFVGRALRCDFTGRMLAGFRFADRPEDVKPLHGSAWLAPLVPNGPPMPVRMTFETHWFGDATMYLTGFGNDRPSAVARK
jgi:hypothetical protein